MCRRVLRTLLLTISTKRSTIDLQLIPKYASPISFHKVYRAKSSRKFYIFYHAQFHSMLWLLILFNSHNLAIADRVKLIILYIYIYIYIYINTLIFHKFSKPSTVWQHPKYLWKINVFLYLEIFTTTHVVFGLKFLYKYINNHRWLFIPSTMTNKRISNLESVM